MPHPRDLFVWTVMGTLLSLAVPTVGIVISGVVFPEFRWVHFPLHSLMEGAGGLIALAIACVLLAETGNKSDTDHYPWVAAAFFGMGVLDLFHAASTSGNHFVWLHSAATFSGGVFLGLVWISRSLPRFFREPQFPVIVAVISFLVGCVSILFPGRMPAMMTSDGAFSTTAALLNVIGGVGFLSASGFYGRRFFATGGVVECLFGMQTALFGAAGILFAYSVVWDGGWWSWHVLRLLAYVASLWYGVRTFRNAEKELRNVNLQLSYNNALLDQKVEERTARLRASEERFELAVQGSTDGIWDWNVLTSEVYYSPRMKDLIGYRDDEFPNVFESFETRLHPDDHDWVLRAVHSHLGDRIPYDVEYRLRTKSGEYRWFRARGQALWNASGEAQRMAGSITDVTEQHRLREWFRLAVEASPAALMMVHQDGRILMANSRSLSLFGYTAEELTGQLIEILVPERYRASHPARRDQFFQTPVQRAMGVELDLLAVRRDGSEFPVKVGLSPVETADGSAVICGVQDITDQRNVMESMRHAKEAAESASLAKSSFLANMSHEIRTPMNGIIGMTQLLSQTELRSHQRDYLATVNESAHILLRLLNDILDFSKIEAGKLELETVDFRISECIARSSQMLVLRAAEKGLEMACRIAPEIPDYLRGDPGRIQQVLVNLFSNAVKFTEAGEIFLNVSAESIMADRARLHFSLKDTGIGISADKLEQIFRPFEQAEGATTRRFGGTGLGLTISRQLVEMMRGCMWVESELGCGSTFHFTAEFGVSLNQHEHEPAELGSLLNLPVLVVDDNSTNRRILGEMLQYWQMQPTLVDSAAAAREALQTAEKKQRPIRLILLDHHMPIEDGLHFAESLRSAARHNPCPMIMISSGASPVDADLFGKFGITRFMTKPVIASELLNEVLRQFGRYTTVRPVQESPTASPRVQPRRVLLVEDNEINRRVALGLLRARGHQVFVAENGQEAINTLATQEFDVVLMDMQMPVMDGYEATTELRRREHETGGHIPIVAMTAEALKGDRERCLATGMDDYVSKPIAPAEMYRAVEQFPALCLPADFGTRNPADGSQQRVEKAKLIVRGTGKTQQKSDVAVVQLPCSTAHLGSPGDGAEAKGESKMQSEPGNSENHSETPATSTLPAINWEVARRLLGNDSVVLTEFSDLLKVEAPRRLAEIRLAIETQDAPLLRRSAHTLKGSTGYFGAEPLIQAAFALEQLGELASFNGTAELLTALEREMDRVIEALNDGPPD